MADLSNTFNTDPTSLNKTLRFLRGNNPNDFSLYHVQGMTCSSPNSLSANEANDQVGFPAAGILVLLSPRTGEQKYIQTPFLSQNIACVTFSKDGRLIAFIENGISPYLSVWLVKEAKPVNYFQVGNSGKLAFHPRKPFIVLIGSLLKDISVYNYLQGTKVAYSRWTTTPLSMCVPNDGKSVIVSGHRKITYFSLQGVESMSGSINIIKSKKGFALGSMYEHTFIDIICGKRKHRKGLYAVTSSGYVCKLKVDIIEKFEKIDTSLTCVAYGLDLLFVGCPDSVVKMCSPDNLSVVSSISLSESIRPGMRPYIKPLAKVETSGIVVSERYKIITSVFSDSSIYSWQVMHTEEGIDYSFIMPSHYKHCRDDGKEDHDSLSSQLQRAAHIRHFVCNASPNLQTKRDVCHGFWAPTQVQGDPKALGCNVNAVRISPDGTEIISGDENGDINVHDATTGATRRVIEAHMSQVTYVEIMYDDDYKMICTGGRDRVIFILDAVHDFSLVQVLCDHSAAITAISLVRCSGTLTLVSAAADSVILIRTAVASHRPQFQITGQVPCSLGKHTFTCSSQVLATGSRNGLIHLFKTDLIRVNEPELIIQDMKSGTTGDGLETLDIDPSSSFLAVGCCSGHTTLYHLQTGNVVTTLNNQRGLAQIKFTRDMQYMICQSFQRIGCALVWKLPVRMTEYMRYKVDRKGETPFTKAKYDSFLKFLTDSEDSCCKSSSSTPSIKSMNLLNRTQSSVTSSQDSECDLEYDRDLYPSSSDCSCSCTHSRIGCNYTTSDASIRMNSMPNISIMSVKDSSSTRVTARKDKKQKGCKKTKYIKRSNTCDNVKQSDVPANRKLNRYNSDLSYVSNTSQQDQATISREITKSFSVVRHGGAANSRTQSGGYDVQMSNHDCKNSSDSYISCEKIQTPLRAKIKLGTCSPPSQKKIQKKRSPSNSKRIQSKRSPSNSKRIQKRRSASTSQKPGQFETNKTIVVNHKLSVAEDIKDLQSTLSREASAFVDSRKKAKGGEFSKTDCKERRASLTKQVCDARSIPYVSHSHEDNSDDIHACGDPFYMVEQIEEEPLKRVDEETTREDVYTMDETLKRTNKDDNVDSGVSASMNHTSHDGRTEDIIKAMQHLLAVRRSEDAMRSQDKPNTDIDNIGTPMRNAHLVTARANSLSGMFHQERRSILTPSRESCNRDRLNNMGYEVITAADFEEPKDNSSNSNLMDLPVTVNPISDMVSDAVKVSSDSSTSEINDKTDPDSYKTCSNSNTEDKAPSTWTVTAPYAAANNPKNAVAALTKADMESQKSQVSSFFKQNDYLQRLKDIRANFEKNIEALKRERQLTEKGPSPES